jgi:hypothetical protein
MSGLAAGVLVLGFALGAGAQQPQTHEPCVLHKKMYTCNLAEFQRVFRGAQRVALETDPGDVAEQRSLKALAQRLGKQVVPWDDADVLMVMKAVPVDNGVLMSPAGVDLARLQVFAPGAKGRFSQLLWSETYTGDADHPWPLVVDALAMQFEESVRKRR